jgi:AmmeMemoRadiSam system protein B
MNSVRQPCVAGHFYPAEPQILQSTVDELLAKAKTLDVAVPKAIIAPHAGYIFSGPIAATIYKTLLPSKDTIKRVILLGPAHRVGFNGIASTRLHQFATPLGLIPVDTDSIQSVLKLPGMSIYEHAYDMEHSLEVQLPFLQTVLSSFTLVPFVVGNADPQLVANLLEHLWGGEETLIVISSDLSHYYDHATAQKLDSATSKAIVELKPDDIADNQACGRIPVKGLLLAAAKLHLHAQVLDLRNSGDTIGPKDRVVGYGAYHFI